MGDLADLGATTRGIWTRRQALDAVSRGRVDGLVLRGEWQTCWPGADGGVELDVEQRAFAAVLASGGTHLPVMSPTSGRKVLRAAACGRLAVEADGKAGHAGTRMAARDQRRDRVSDALGWRTERCTWFEARCRQDELARRMLGAAGDQERGHDLR